MLCLGYFLLPLFIGAVGLAYASAYSRRQRFRSVTQTLAVLVGQNLPLPAGLRAAARGEPRAVRRVYEWLAGRLETGDRLSAALRYALPSCPGTVSGAIEASEQAGTLPAVLRSLAAENWRRGTRPVVLGAPAAYSLVLLLLIPAMLAFVVIKVIPKFRDIFRDFDTALPPLTEWVIHAAADSYLIALALLPPVVAAVVFVMLRTAVARRPAARMTGFGTPLAALLDGIMWSLPLLRRHAEAQAMARQLPLMQAAVSAGHDLPAAARQAACVGVNYFARRRLWRWAAVLEAGADPPAAARRTGFPEPFVQALAAGMSGARMSPALEYLAAYYRTLCTHWSQVAISAAMPAVVIVWALCVGTIVLSLFLPLVALIQSMSGSID